MATAAEEAAALFDNPQSHHQKTHPEDAAGSPAHSSDASFDHEDKHSHRDDDEDEDGNTMPAVIDPVSNYHIPRGTHFDANTGPKGVIADARAFEQAKKQQWKFRTHGDSSAAPAVTKERSVSPSQDEDLDDKEFFDRWRKSELAKVMSRDVNSRRRSPSVRQYGTMQRVDASGYLDAIEKVGHETTVVVCIYDDEVCLLNLSQPPAGSTCWSPLLIAVMHAPVGRQPPSRRLPREPRAETHIHPVRQAPLRRGGGRYRQRADRVGLPRRRPGCEHDGNRR